MHNTGPLKGMVASNCVWKGASHIERVQKEQGVAESAAKALEAKRFKRKQNDYAARLKLLAGGVECFRHQFLKAKKTNTITTKRDEITIQMSEAQDELLLFTSGEGVGKATKLAFTSCQLVVFGPVTPALRVRDPFQDSSSRCCSLVFASVTLDLTFQTTLECCQVFLAIQERQRATDPEAGMGRMDLTQGLLHWEIGRLRLEEQTMIDGITKGKALAKTLMEASKSITQL